MVKSKEDVERKLEMNKNHSNEIGTAIERRHIKETYPHGGKFAGLGKNEK